MIRFLSCPFKPPIVKDGQTFAILGEGFRGIKEVKIGETSLSFEIKNNNFISVCLPKGLKSDFLNVDGKISPMKLIIINEEKAVVKEEMLN